MRMFASGITSYQWDQSYVNGMPRRIMVPIDGMIVLFEENLTKDINTSQRSMIYDPRVVYDGLSPISSEHGPSSPDAVFPAMAPILSPDGKKVSFVVKDDIYILYLDTGHTVRVTQQGVREGVSCGLADFLAQEEMDRYKCLTCV